ncbi:unnamed protein product [Darwinula stevensoni]|uniref:39S ribosomal protein L28, mitochondrial n=1 Tax=Darwinula stevensoni TaxID=69355 RepID=A0A7R8XE10_9CRUS|nr:unnamed protein product [Darwinula stevensoni]CAG0893586.1 unnamed protein product [Darwinula stevensoni]
MAVARHHYVLDYTRYLGIRKKIDWSKGVLARLPEHYKKFYEEWKHGPEIPVHWKPNEVLLYRHEETGEIKRRENIPIPITYPKEHNQGIWGGEGVVYGYKKKVYRKRRVPHWWAPTLIRTVVYSEILDKHMSLVTSAADLKSELALSIKRLLLLSIARKNLYPDDPKKQKEVYDKYQQYSIPEDEADWYGLSLQYACLKQEYLEAQEQPEPLKHRFRRELIDQLIHSEKNMQEIPKSEKGWLERLQEWNPFQNKS